MATSASAPRYQQLNCRSPGWLVSMGLCSRTERCKRQPPLVRPINGTPTAAMSITVPATSASAPAQREPSCKSAVSLVQTGSCSRTARYRLPQRLVSLINGAQTAAIFITTRATLGLARRLLNLSCTSLAQRRFSVSAKEPRRVLSPSVVRTLRVRTLPVPI